MAGVKAVEIIEGDLVVTDCAGTTAIYDIDCGCDDGIPDVPPPVQDPSGTTPCRVADYTSKQILSYFEKFTTAINSFGTGSFGTNVQNACNQIGLSAYVVEFNLWIQNLSVFVGLNQVVTQYYAWGAKQTQLECWLLGCLPATGEMSEATKQCWRTKIQEGKTTFAPYSAILEALYGMTSIIPVSKYQELANIGSTVPATCESCGSSDQSCSPGEWADFRQDALDWTGYSGTASQFPLDTSIFGTSNFTISGGVDSPYGLQAPYCDTGQSCIAGGSVITFTTPIKLCYFYYLVEIRTGQGALHGANSSVVGVVTENSAGLKEWVTGYGFSYEDYGNISKLREQEWRGEKTDVKKIYIIHRSGRYLSTLVKARYNNDQATASAKYPTIDGVPYVQKSAVQIPANVNQAGWDAIFATESAGRIYEFEGTMSNVTITPRAGDAFRTKTGKDKAKFYGGNKPTTWTLDTGTTYYATYSRTINKAGAGTGVVSGYTINDDASYPRAHWMIAARYTLSPGTMLRHVATLQNCRDNTGTYFIDEGASRIYVNIAVPVTSGLIEIAHTKNAFVLGVNDVVLENLFIDLYAPDFQEGMIQTASPLTIGGTQILGCQIDWSACNGIKVGLGSKILENLFGVSGMTSAVFQGSDVVFSGNEQTGLYNEQHTNEGYEASFLKNSRTLNAIISSNTLRLGGDGKGLWDDLGCVYALYLDNVIQNCSRAGIMTELAFASRILKNRILDCQKGQTGQPQRGEILIVNSQGWNGQKIIVQENQVVNFGNGGAFFGLSQSSRGTGTAPDGTTVTYLTQNVDVSLNEFWCRDIATGVQKSGTYQDYDPNSNFNTAANGLSVDNNAYHMSSSLQMFQQGGSNKTMAQWQALTALVASDQNSTIDQASVPSEVDA